MCCSYTDQNIKKRYMKYASVSNLPRVFKLTHPGFEVPLSYTPVIFPEYGIKPRSQTFLKKQKIE